MRRFLINSAIVIILLSSPVTLISIGWGYMQIYHQFGMTLFLTACACGFVTVLGVASLVAEKEEELKRLQRDL